MRSRPARLKPQLFEILESRELFSASFAILVMREPLPTDPAQAGHPPPPPPIDNPNRMSVGLDISVRNVPGGVSLNVAASSLFVIDLSPSGSIEIYDGGAYLGTVRLGSTVRAPHILANGSHTLTAIYSGDADFLPTQTASTLTIDVPPAQLAVEYVFSTNNLGERVRPPRRLSYTNYFESANLTVAAIPTPPSDDPGNPGVMQGPAPLGPPTPIRRFSNVSFSARLSPVEMREHHVDIFGLLRAAGHGRG